MTVTAYEQGRLAEVTQVAGRVKGIERVLERADEFPSPAVALLAGVGMSEKGRRLTDEMFNERWNTPVPATFNADEVVIGSGPHALIYAAIRAKQGINVVVLERNTTAGGSFACSNGPGFWLNSRNRPGRLGLPGEGVGLNVLPGVPLQPSMIGGGEYQTNNMLGWVIRMNLRMTPCRVLTGQEVTKVTKVGARFKVETATGLEVRAKRVIWALGVGDPKPFSATNQPVPDGLLTFEQFMGRMDDPFPLRGMRRVAVIGGGDSGRTTVEALLGIGPSTGQSVAALDYVESIDWYGVGDQSRVAWCDSNRARYQRIGPYFNTPRLNGKDRLNVFPNPGYESVQIGPNTYDMVVNCTGYAPSLLLPDAYQPYQAGGVRQVAAQVINSGDGTSLEQYLIGPCTRYGTTSAERRAAPSLGKIPENATSLFRWAPLTAAFAAVLPPVGQPLVDALAEKVDRFDEVAGSLSIPEEVEF